MTVSKAAVDNGSLVLNEGALRPETDERILRCCYPSAAAPEDIKHNHFAVIFYEMPSPTFRGADLVTVPASVATVTLPLARTNSNISRHVEPTN